MKQQNQHDLYAEAGAQFAPSSARRAKAMERDADKARDLEQDIHCELFRSFARFDGRCSLKTWVWRVSHNVCAEHRLRAARRPKPIPLDQIEHMPVVDDVELATAEDHAVVQARTLIRQLPTLDAQVMLLWLEGESGKNIADVTGLSQGAVSTRIHRIKALIAETLSASTHHKDPHHER